ncbi:serine/threonine protein kinase [Streptosporangium minutum]|uniref:non-specific serine/threonine protein kinase n=1 Tax=Streptosporangium minutum TaxID=569862 RepID=A0A243RWB7_9ACTN|nr:serine/threonine protein kinase [Streptosporangium minutum]OUC99498.1 serine/threonine protein kinase [Streptosporangium minutum]
MVAQGTTLAGRYRLDTRIGAGGMGEVWRGEDIVLARTVAVKVLLPGRTDDPGFLVRFQGEARAMATVNHPGVVDVYDYGVHEVPGAGATAYLVMKFVDGEPLDRLLGRLGSIAPGAAMELIAQAASALQAVHDQGIVHRDVKPGNLLVRSDGTLVLTDFGIARSDAASRLTDAGMVLGTAAYCAPEQAEGAPVTPAVDIYALGVVAYECLAGQRPFDGDTPVTIALKHIRETPPPLPPHVPPAIRALVERALSKDPARRFPSATAMSTAARQAAHLGPETGATAMPPVSYAARESGWEGPSSPQTGRHGAALPETGWHAPPSQMGLQGAVPPTTAPSPGPATEAVQQGRGRRAAKRPRRKGGMLAVSAAAGVICVGLVAVAINGMAASSAVPTDSQRGVDPVPSVSESPEPSRTKGGRKTTKPTPTVPQPNDRPTQTTRTPTPTPTPLPKRRVPDVMGMKPEAAKEALTKAGLKVKVSESADLDTSQCVEVVEQHPGASTMWDPRKAVEIVVANNGCPPSPTPTPTPTATPGP